VDGSSWAEIGIFRVSQIQIHSLLRDAQGMCLRLLIVDRSALGIDEYEACAERNSHHREHENRQRECKSSAIGNARHVIL
jgi:hypothetical protein